MTVRDHQRREGNQSRQGNLRNLRLPCSVRDGDKYDVPGILGVIRFAYLSAKGKLRSFYDSQAD